MARRGTSAQERLFSEHIYRAGRNSDPYRSFLRLNHKQEFLAFIDESYQPAFADRPLGFYTLTATVLPADEIPRMREGLQDALGGAYWHTTEAYHNPDQGQAERPGLYRGMIPAMITACDDYAAENIITVHTRVPPIPLNHDFREDPTLSKVHKGQAEKTLDQLIGQKRAECITSMMKTLQDHPNSPVQAVVFEARQSRTENDKDRALITRLKDQKIISPRTQAAFASPTVEPNLWAPDLYAWSARRALLNGEPQWLQQSTASRRWIDASTQREILPEPLRTQGRNQNLRELIQRTKNLQIPTRHQKDLETGRGGPSIEELAHRRQQQRRREVTQHQQVKGPEVGR